MDNKFRLKRLEINNHSFLGDFNVNFESNESNNLKIDEPFTTLIIGANGTGKSQILRIIIDIFRELEYQKYREKKRKITKYHYNLEYKINKNTYIIKSEGKSGKIFLKNGNSIGISELSLPQKLLASSFMLNDKFLFADNTKTKLNKVFYEYLGIRGTSGTARTKGYLKKVVESTINSSSNKRFILNLKLLLEFLELKPFFNIYFHPKFRSYFFNEELTNKKFVSFFKEWKKHRPNRDYEPFSVPYFKNHITEKDINQLVSFINRNRTKIKKEKGSYFFEYHLFFSDIKSNEEVIKEFDSIKKLMKLDILSHPSIEIKKNVQFDFEESSSGEYHLISTIIGILANLKDNSLILIDEPEISMHPNWQIKYVDYLKKIFANYPSCHFIIATHSHFMVSDLKKESSSIVSLKRNKENQINAYTHSENTYGWTAEDILYNIFEVPTVRNYYLANKVGDILSLISKKEQNKDKIKEKVNELKKIQMNLKDVDPLKDVIKKLIDKFG